MSKPLRALLFISGLLTLPSWGFRLYILFIRWGFDPYRWPTIFVSLASVGIGGFLIWMAIQGNRAGRRSYAALFGVSLFTMGFWTYRLARILIYPENDPNPQAHLRLSITFLIIGVLLCVSGWRGRSRKLS